VATTFARSYTATPGWIIAGLVLGPPGVVLLFTSAWLAGILMALGGVPLLVGNVWLLVRRPPRLRVDDHGLWFGGGDTVPWSDLKSVYVSTTPSLGGGLGFMLTRNNRALSFDFVDARATRRRLPLPLRLRMRGIGIGDLDLSSAEFADDLASVQATISAHSR
jgi:hypothetical protein